MTQGILINKGQQPFVGTYHITSYKENVLSIYFESKLRIGAGVASCHVWAHAQLDTQQIYLSV